jgi:hypothetical protein
VSAWVFWAFSGCLIVVLELIGRIDEMNVYSGTQKL